MMWCRYPNKMVADPVRGTVMFELTTGEIFAVEELVGMILSHARDQAEIMGSEPVDGAVLTVRILPLTLLPLVQRSPKFRIY